jgi:hypothetical protein
MLFMYVEIVIRLLLTKDINRLSALFSSTLMTPIREKINMVMIANISQCSSWEKVFKLLFLKLVSILTQLSMICSIGKAQILS